MHAAAHLAIRQIGVVLALPVDHFVSELRAPPDRDAAAVVVVVARSKLLLRSHHPSAERSDAEVRVQEQHTAERGPCSRVSDLRSDRFCSAVDRPRDGGTIGLWRQPRDALRYLGTEYRFDGYLLLALRLLYLLALLCDIV